MCSDAAVFVWRIMSIATLHYQTAVEATCRHLRAIGPGEDVAKAPGLDLCLSFLARFAHGYEELIVVTGSEDLREGARDMILARISLVAE